MCYPYNYNSNFATSEYCVNFVIKLLRTNKNKKKRRNSTHIYNFFLFFFEGHIYIYIYMLFSGFINQNYYQKNYRGELISVKKELNRLCILDTLITWFASYLAKSSQILKNYSIMLFTSNTNSL